MVSSVTANFSNITTAKNPQASALATAQTGGSGEEAREVNDSPAEEAQETGKGGAVNVKA